MILIDANLLIYAVNSTLAQHPAAKTWWESVLAGSETVGIPWIVILAFLRICTNARVFPAPLTPNAALDYVGEWLDLPLVQAVGPGRNHWPILRNLLSQTGAGGNLTTDAHIAALALEHGCTLYSADNDFKRFPGIRHVNPLAH
jgi:uncharacterized protein